METNLCRSPFNEAKRWEYCLDHVPGGSGRVALKSWALRCTQDSIVPEAWTMKPVQLPHFCMQGTHTHTLSLLDVCQQPHRAGRERRGGRALFLGAWSLNHCRRIRCLRFYRRRYYYRLQSVRALTNRCQARLFSFFQALCDSVSSHSGPK